MSKKKTGLFIAFGAALGAAAACVSYYLKYKSFHDELDKDFHDYEDEDEPEEETAQDPEPARRNYITIDGGKSHESAEKAEDSEDGPKECAKESEDSPEDADNSSDADAPSQQEPAGPSAGVTVEEDTDGEKE